MSKQKKKTLHLYAVFVEYYGGFSNSGFMMGGYALPFNIGKKQSSCVTVVAYTKSEAVRKTHEILAYCERPYGIVKVKKATKASVKDQKVNKRKKKHKNKKPLRIYTPKKSKSDKRKSWISL